MGTNYYAITDRCDSCGRENRRHICKSLISFEGHFIEGEWDPEKGEWPVTPWLTSWEQWKAFVRSTVVVHIENEYGDLCTVEDFIARVEATDPVARRRQYDWMREHEPDRTGAIRADFEWLDADGFSFYGGGFS